MIPLSLAFISRQLGEALNEKRHGKHRPELCVGSEQAHALDELRAAVAEVFGDFEMRPNEPFHGAYVPHAVASLILQTDRRFERLLHAFSLYAGK